ncbi:MAG: ribosomal-processing cysteine protease Prp [Bacillota bacterium]
MTKIEIVRSDGKIIGFYVSGHSGYAKSGRDIVCSAVSALTQSAAYGLTDIAGIEAKCSLGEEELSCGLNAEQTCEQRLKADMILETMLAGLLSIEAGYPRNLKISQREV